jgi:hypothetical protein
MPIATSQPPANPLTFTSTATSANPEVWTIARAEGGISPATVIASTTTPFHSLASYLAGLSGQDQSALVLWAGPSSNPVVLPMQVGDFIATYSSVSF